MRILSVVRYSSYIFVEVLASSVQLDSKCTVVLCHSGMLLVWSCEQTTQNRPPHTGVLSGGKYQQNQPVSLSNEVILVRNFNCLYTCCSALCLNKREIKHVVRSFVFPQMAKQSRGWEDSNIKRVGMLVENFEIVP